MMRYLLKPRSKICVSQTEINLTKIIILWMNGGYLVGFLCCDSMISNRTHIIQVSTYRKHIVLEWGQDRFGKQFRRLL